jgi:hypothetical protein
MPMLGAARGEERVLPVPIGIGYSMDGTEMYGLMMRGRVMVGVGVLRIPRCPLC